MASKNNTVRITINAHATIEVLVDHKDHPYCGFLVVVLDAADKGSQIYPLHITNVLIMAMFNFMKGILPAQLLFGVAWASRKTDINRPVSPIMEISIGSPTHKAQRLEVIRPFRPPFVSAGCPITYPTPFSYGVNLL